MRYFFSTGNVESWPFRPLLVHASINTKISIIFTLRLLEKWRSVSLLTCSFRFLELHRYLHFVDIVKNVASSSVTMVELLTASGSTTSTMDHTVTCRQKIQTCIHNHLWCYPFVVHFHLIFPSLSLPLSHHPAIYAHSKSCNIVHLLMFLWLQC